MKKCLLSVLTASIMTLTAVPFTAIAAETAPTTSQTSEAAEVNDLSVIAQKLKDFIKEKGYNATVLASDEKVKVSFKQLAVGEKEYDATAINSEFRTFCEKNSLNFSLVQVIFQVDATAESIITENGVKYQLYTDHAVAVGYTEEIDKNLIIADSVKNVPVTEIAKEAFAGCDSIETLKIPDSVTFVGAGAFRECTNLKSAEFSDNSMTYDGNFYEWEGIFVLCPSLEKVTYSALRGDDESRASLAYFLFDVEQLDKYSGDFENDYVLNGDMIVRLIPKSFKTVVVTAGEEIAGSEFSDMVTLEEVSLPDTIKTIGYCAFGSCENLKKVNIPKSINYIGDYAFGMCKNVEFGDIEFSDSIEYIGTRAFELCNGITSLHIPASIKKIGGNAFKSCENLKNFTLDGTPEIVSGLDKTSIKYAYGIIGNCPDIENVIVKSEKFTFIDNENNANDITIEKALFNCSVFEGTEDKYTSPEPSVNIPKSAKIQVLELKTDYNFLSYNELTKLTNEEFSEKFNLSDYHFGDDSISDEIKFQEYLNQPIAGFVGDNYESVAYAAYLRFTRGENVPYITFSVDRYTKMDNSLTPEDFGYPKEWKITAYDCVLSTESRYPRQMHEYRIEVPIDIISDFEEYVRLEKSSYYSRNYSKNNPYGITSFFDIDYQFASMGGNISNLYGDANCDFEVSMADAVLIMQSLANPDKYVLDGIGRINADMDGDGITNADALAIQKKLLKLD